MNTHQELEQATATSIIEAEKRPYHAPELLAHGELTVLTKGAGATGVPDLGFYVSIPG